MENSMSTPASNVYPGSISGSPTLEQGAVVVPSAEERFDPFSFRRPADEQVRNSMIMIIDDETSVTLAVRKFLFEAGFKNFVLLDDATQAIRSIELHEPDLVLLDIRMQVNGLDILRTMKQNEKTKGIPVITLTGSVDSKTRLQALGMGADDFLTKPVDMGELVARVRNTLCGKIFRDQLARYSSELEDDLLRDSLTGVANRRAFDYELDRRMTEWTRQRTPMALVLVDADHFKGINDRMGHRQGDQILKMIAKRMSETVRGMDLVARYGGEEFAVIMPGAALENAMVLGERIRRSIESCRFDFKGEAFHVTVSVGMTESCERDDVKSFFERADKALYLAKSEGRNCCRSDDGRAFENRNGISAAIGTDRLSFAGRLAEATNQAARILVIDDEPSTALMVRKLLIEAGYYGVKAIHEPGEALAKIRTNMPDLILCDINMPGISGIEILEAVKANPETRDIPFLFLTSATESDVKVRCLNLGATDFLGKPVNGAELIARVQNTLLAKAHIRYLSDESSRLEREVRQRTAELFESRREAIQCLARAAEMRDDATGSHVYRVGRYAAILGEEFGFDEERCEWLEYAAQLHDVGKIGIPDHILKKPGKLTPEEYEFIKGHCILGRQVIRNEELRKKGAGEKASSAQRSRFFDNCDSPIMRMAAVVTESHHERWDGTGYPHQLKGEAIPLEGRIAAVADVFDAISSRRCYKDAIELETCFRMIEEASGTQFDPSVVAAFLKRKADFVSVFLQYNDNA
jgi:putative two-component system response regulator